MSAGVIPNLCCSISVKDSLRHSNVVNASAFDIRSVVCFLTLEGFLELG
jgi:hypothetical protein